MPGVRASSEPTEEAVSPDRHRGEGKTLRCRLGFHDYARGPHSLNLKCRRCGRWLVWSVDH